MKNKNLARAVVLSLLATSVVGWYSCDLGYAEGQKTVIFDKDTIVNKDNSKDLLGAITTGDGTNYSYSIKVNNGVSLTLDDVSLYGPKIDSNGDVIINNSLGIAGIALAGTDTGDYKLADIIAKNLTINHNEGWGRNGIQIYGADNGGLIENKIRIDVVENTTINAKANGIFISPTTSKSSIDISTGSLNINADVGIKIDGNNNNVKVDSDDYVVLDCNGGLSNNSSGDGIISINAGNDISITAEKYWGVAAGSGDISLNSKNGNIAIEAAGNGVQVSNENVVTISTENGQNRIVNDDTIVGKNAVYANNGTLTMSAVQNIIEGGTITEDSSTGIPGRFGDKTVIYANNGADVNITAKASATKSDSTLAVENLISGTVRAEGEDTTVKIDGVGGNNYIYSSAHGKDYNGDETLAAVFAHEHGIVNIDGDKNFIATYCGPNDTAQENEKNTELERVVWAQDHGKINITGITTVIAGRAEESAGAVDGVNHMGIAIVAGSNQKDITDDHPDDYSEVNVSYNSGSYISGDVVSGFGGKVSIKQSEVQQLSDGVAAASGAPITINGNLLAANGGIMNVDLGNGGVLIGRIDDYEDAVETETENTRSKHENLYDPVFSEDVKTAGTVNLNMGEGARWNVSGQSWVSSLTMGKDSIIDMASKYNYEHSLGKTAPNGDKLCHALTIREISGAGTFVMDLNHDNHKESDMLYIASGEGTFSVDIINPIEEIDNIVNEELRFATVKDKDIKFDKVSIKDGGVFNVDYSVGNEEYIPGESDNNEYNGSDPSLDKPGYGDASADEGGNGINWYIQGIKDKNTSDAGETIINMSRANYSNAVYMDRLNKRLGEARYIDGEEGVWVRTRHDRIGKSDAFRSKNTMYEIGYDKLNECDNGERRVGVAIDYMDGSTEYSDVAGKGEIKRKGLWAYDTWLGDKGHYSDFVAKWGHLENEFDIRTMTRNEKVTGDYSNNVFSVSAEYGRKKDIGNEWYFEPQAQLQYARVTGADYTSSQNTKVELDDIDSLIARAGFRIGKNLDERSTVYLKADVLHEFLGEQDIYAADGTGVMERTFENEGTWYDLGFGFATALSEDSYIYADFEKSFGNDNDETYQINVGVNYSF